MQFGVVLGLHLSLHIFLTVEVLRAAKSKGGKTLDKGVEISKGVGKRT
jgi:hypothetical protein